MFNDIKCCFENKASPLYSCSLDSEKYFDSIWHKALFQKLTNTISHAHWLILYRRCNDLMGCVNWNGIFCSMFDVGKDERDTVVFYRQSYLIILFMVYCDIYTLCLIMSALVIVNLM